ncbi:MAG: aminotransferase class V-fold PLP-dependent enzyme [Clostridiales bacterium]|nr:aminotransferase class V-fold PLP-dependent enzyme [Clostridiales bacterium]
MIYLDHAATGGFKPTSVLSAVASSLKLCANPGRGGHRLAVACSERVNACRNLLSELFGGYGFDRVAFTKNCSEALNIAILGGLKAGDHAIATCLEHNSVLRPLEHLKKSGVIDYSIAGLSGGTISPQEIASLVRENTKMCIVTTASNVCGVTPDLKAIRSMLPEEVLLVADGAQGAGHLPISMKETGIDALALAGHKGLHGIQGAGALLFSERFDPEPLLFGGTGSESYNLDMPAFYPDKLECGTLSYPAIVSLYEGALIVKCNREKHATQLLRLTTAVYEGLKRLDDYTAYFQPNSVGIAAFAHKRLSSEEVAGILDEYGIAVRGGLHCAPLAHKALGTYPSGLVRASFSPFQGMREVDILLKTLRAIR